eukprot:jgi/Bigna1/81590/fgenesh1_pg.82_\
MQQRPKAKMHASLALKRLFGGQSSPVFSFDKKKHKWDGDQPRNGDDDDDNDESRTQSRQKRARRSRSSDHHRRRKRSRSSSIRKKDYKSSSRKSRDLKDKWQRIAEDSKNDSNLLTDQLGNLEDNFALTSHKSALEDKSDDENDENDDGGSNISDKEREHRSQVLLKRSGKKTKEELSKHDEHRHYSDDDDDDYKSSHKSPSSFDVNDFLKRQTQSQIANMQRRQRTNDEFDYASDDECALGAIGEYGNAGSMAAPAKGKKNHHDDHKNEEEVDDILKEFENTVKNEGTPRHDDYERRRRRRRSRSRSRNRWSRRYREGGEEEDDDRVTDEEGRANDNQGATGKIPKLMRNLDKSRAERDQNYNRKRIGFDDNRMVESSSRERRREGRTSEKRPRVSSSSSLHQNRREGGEVELPSLNSIQRGKVVGITTFGAFVRLELFPEISGLVHISQLAHQRVEKVEEVLDKDATIWVKVIDIQEDVDHSNKKRKKTHHGKRISLSFKYVDQKTGEDLDPDGSQYDKQQKSRGERRKEPATYQRPREVHGMHMNEDDDPRNVSTSPELQPDPVLRRSAKELGPEDEASIERHATRTLEKEAELQRKYAATATAAMRYMRNENSNDVVVGNGNNTTEKGQGERENSERADHDESDSADEFGFVRAVELLHVNQPDEQRSLAYNV